MIGARARAYWYTVASGFTSSVFGVNPFGPTDPVTNLAVHVVPGVRSPRIEVPSVQP